MAWKRRRDSGDSVLKIDKTRRILDKYDKLINDHFEGGIEVKNHSGDIALFGFKMSDGKLLEHGRWMCQKAKEFDSPVRANRWLGFIQCILLVYRIVGLGDLRDDTRPVREDDVPPQPPETKPDGGGGDLTIDFHEGDSGGPIHIKATIVADSHEHFEEMVEVAEELASKGVPIVTPTAGSPDSEDAADIAELVAQHSPGLADALAQKIAQDAEDAETGEVSGETDLETLPDEEAPKIVLPDRRLPGATMPNAAAAKDAEPSKAETDAEPSKVEADAAPAPDEDAAEPVAESLTDEAKTENDEGNDED